MENPLRPGLRSSRSSAGLENALFGTVKGFHAVVANDHIIADDGKDGLIRYRRMCRHIHPRAQNHSLVVTDQRALNQIEALTVRSEEHTSELQSLMRISYAVFCLKKKTKHIRHTKRYN